MTRAPALPAAVMRVMRVVASFMFWLLLRVGRRSQRPYRTSAGCQPLDTRGRHAARRAPALLLTQKADLLVEALLTLGDRVRGSLHGRLCGGLVALAERILEQRHPAEYRRRAADVPWGLRPKFALVVAALSRRRSRCAASRRQAFRAVR